MNYTTEDYIDSLHRDKADLVSNLIEKGVEASDSETFTSLVPKVLDIKGGLDIQNGRLVNYKALSGTVPAGTFIKLNTVYTGYELYRGDSYYIRYVIDSIALSNNVYVIAEYRYQGYGSTYYYYRAFEVSRSGISEYATPVEAINSGLSSYRDGFYMYRIDDTHFAVCNFISHGNGQVVVRIYQYENQTISLVSENLYSHTQVNTAYSGSSPNITSSICTEDNDNLYIHVSTAYTSASSSKAFYNFTINKQTYSVSLHPNTSIKSNVYLDLYAISETKLIGHNGNVVTIIDFDKSTGTYTFTNSTLNNVGTIGTNQTNLVWFIELGNELLMIFKYSNTVLKYVKLNISNNIVSATGPYILDDETDNTEISNAFYKLIRKIAKVNNTTAVLCTGEYYEISAPRMLVIQNSNGVMKKGTLLGSTNTSSNSSGPTFSQAGMCGDVLLIHQGRNFDGIPLLMSISTIDAGLNVNQESGSAIVISPATSVIAGITTSECTDTTAGDVYLLDA